MIRGSRVGAGVALASLAYLGALGWARRRPGPAATQAELEAVIDSWFSEHGTEVRHRYLGTTWGRVHCLDLGSGPRPPLVFLPGLGTAGAGYHELLSLLARTRRVVALDRPGTGLSDPLGTPGHPRSLWAGQVREVALALGLQRFDISGHSLGGFVAGAFAVDHPEMVGRVALVSPLGLARTHPANWAPSLIPGLMEILGAVEREVEGRGLGGHDGVSIGPLHVSPDRDRFHERSSGRFLRGSDLTALPRLLRPLGFRTESALLPELGLLAGRVLVGWGEDDDEVPLAPVAQELRAYPGLELAVVPAAGHYVPFDQPELAAGLISGWLDREAEGLEEPVGRLEATSGEPA